MSENIVEDYGWNTDSACSCSYLVPAIMALLERLGVRRILDLGAGNGALCSAISKTGRDVVGIEYDKKGVDIARASFPEIHFYNFGVQDDPKELMAMESPFEAVVSTEVIEHLFSPHQLPIYAAQTLQDEGLLIVSTPYHGYLKNLALALLDKWDFHHDPLWHGGHIKFWSRATLSALLARHGFKVLEFHGVGRIPYLWKSMIIVAQKECAIERQLSMAEATESLPPD
jgi:2-polyprenyl-3-methyl-5-hydroxy-6-metoxy-1,4-benzoquinol methylase